MRPVLKAFLAFTALAVVAALVMFLYVMNSGVSALDQPGPIETFVAGNVRDLAIGRRARNVQNPVARSPEIIAAGRAHFADHCALCHGNDGSGDSALGRGMYPRPPDLRLARTQNLSDGELFYIIQNGIRFTGMPGFDSGTEEGAQESWHLVHFIRHLPDLSEPELAEMESLNPAPPSEVLQRIEEERFLRGDDVPVSVPESTPHKHEGGGL
jgi:mono/diheme cytochrome c family protein